MDTIWVTLPRGEWEGRSEKERRVKGSGSGEAQEPWCRTA